MSLKSKSFKNIVNFVNKQKIKIQLNSGFFYLNFR